MALPAAASLCKADGETKKPDDSSEVVEKPDPSPLQLLLSSLQSEYYEIKKADLIMQKHWSKWMQSVESWLQNQVYTQEQLELILKASVAEYNDKVSNENDRVEVCCYPTEPKKPIHRTDDGEQQIHPVGWRANALLARFRASKGLEDNTSPLTSVLAEPAQSASGDAGDAPEDWRPSSMFIEDPQDSEQDKDNDETASRDMPGNLHFRGSRQDDMTRISAITPAEQVASQPLAVQASVPAEMDFEDPFRRNSDKNDRLDKEGGSKSVKRKSLDFRSWLLVSDENEDTVLRNKAEHISAMPHAGMKYDEGDRRFDVHHLRQATARLLRRPTTELFIAIVILSNSIVVGVEVDWTVKHPKATTLPVGFSILGYAFNLIFAIEVGLRMFALMRDFFFGTQWGWNLFDFALVVCSVAEVTIEVIYRSGSENFSSLRIVRMVRITRILRVLRVARVVRLLVALRLLFVQILGTLRSVFWAMVLLVLILYTFAMIFAQVSSEYLASMSDEDKEDPIVTVRDIIKYWSTVPRSMFTLYKTVTGGVDWEHATLALSDIHWFWVAVFLVFLSFTVFAVLNVVVGVFCQSAIQSASMDHENAVRLKLQEKLNFTRKIRTLFMDIDASRDGMLTYHELEAHLDDENVSAYFDSLGIDPSDSWDLFKLLDVDSSQSIDVEEFIEGCMRLRGPAKALQLAKIAHENKIMRKQLSTFMRFVQSSLGSMLPPPQSFSHSALLSSPVAIQNAPGTNSEGVGMSMIKSRRGGGSGHGAAVS